MTATKSEYRKEINMKKIGVKHIFILFTIVNIILILSYLLVDSITVKDIILKIGQTQAFFLLSVAGALVRRKFSDNKKDSFQEYFLSTNFLINAKIGVIVIGIPMFTIWVLFIN